MEIIQKMNKEPQNLSEGRLLVLTELEKDTLQRMKKDPCKANIDAWNLANKNLAEFLAGEKEPSFPNRIEALAWLQRQGYKIAKSKLYKDCKQGLLKLQNDGSVLESDLKRYARKVGLNQLSNTPDADPNDLQSQKAEAEVDKLRAQIKLYEFQLKEKLSKYILRSDFEMEFAAKVAVLKSGIEHMLYSYAFEWAELVENGDKETASQRLTDAMMQILKKQFNNFANIKNFEVVFTKEKITDTEEAKS
ncbi:MAG: hypothetical protein JRC91_01570 [Deltaproteobacteria bacterium]|nr:hypothetical protein [Deltaproteobacteria bacterium]